MGDVESLRRFRKAKERAEAQARAAENCAKHGRPKAERQGTKARRTLADRKLEGHRRDASDATGDHPGDDPGDDEPPA